MSGSSTTAARRSRPSRRRPASASSEAANSPPATLASRVCTLPRSSRDAQVRPAMQKLRLAPHRGGADDARRPAGMSNGSAADRRVAAGAKDQRVARILALQRAGQHDARRQCGFQVLQAVHREIDAAVHQRLVDFLGEQPLAADIGQPAVLHASPVVRMTCSSNTSHAAAPGRSCASMSRERRGSAPGPAASRGCRPAAAGARRCGADVRRS